MNKAVIMAGGFGTRLRPLTMKIPKPMVPIMNQPMMEHIVNLLKQHSIKDVVSLLYFQPDVITNHFGDGTNFGIKMQYVHAQADYGTAGSVKNAYQYLNERFIIISGDVLTDFDLTKAIEFHIKKKSKATILLTRHPTPLQYGIVMTDTEGKITRFLEKPSWGQVFSDTINTGIYILEPDILDMIPYQEAFDFSKDLFPTMLVKKMPLYGYIVDGYWRDVGNLDEYQIGQNDALQCVLKVACKGTEKNNVFVGDGTNISPTAKFDGRVLVGNNTKIGDYSELIDCVIGNNVTIGKGVKLTRVTLWDNVTVGDFAQMIDDVICSEVEIGQSVTISENVFISNDCKIGKSAMLYANIKLWPNKQVEEGATLSRSLVQEEKWQRELFSEARISGISNVEIHPEFCAKLGAAVGLSIGTNKTVISSRAPDNCSRIMKRAFSAGLASVGVKVNDMQVSSIPQTRQELRSGRFDGGVHIRKSPRNSNMHDIILFNREGKDIFTDVAKKIERYFFGEDVVRVSEEKMGNVAINANSNEAYVQRYIDAIDVELVRKRKFKILVDYSFGLAATILPNILGYFNADVISINNYVDQSKFSPGKQESNNGDTNKPDEIAIIMRNLNYEIGFQIETGAEKISMIDERGVWYSHHRLLCIITKLFLETHRHLEPYKIAISILVGSEIEQIAKDYNVEVIRIKNSHSAMMEATNDEKVLFAGGSYGGFVFSGFLFAADGMFTVGQVLEMLAKTNLRISELDDSLPVRYQSSINVPVPWEKKGTVMRRAMEFSEGIERQLVEGIKLFKDDGDSILLYPEKEFASFTVISDSSNFETSESLAKTYAAYINQWKEEG